MKSAPKIHVAQVCATPRGPCVTALHKNPAVAWLIALGLGTLARIAVRRVGGGQ